MVTSGKTVLRGSVTAYAKGAARALVPGFVDPVRQWHARQRRGVIEAILHRATAPDTARSEGEFNELQQSFKGVPEYGYDAASNWERGVERCKSILKLGGSCEPGLRILEAGCGDGMTGYMLSCYGHRVTLTDLEDWREQRSLRLSFVGGRLEDSLSLPNDSFDIVFSYNTLEHVDEPDLALRELVRVCRPGGLIHLNFGPLYCSPWGLHAYRMLRMPYPQFLFSEAFIRNKLDETGIWDLGRKRIALQPLNRWRPQQFARLWTDCGCKIAICKTWQNLHCLRVIINYPAAFSGRGLSYEDVVTEGTSVTMRKPSN